LTVTYAAAAGAPYLDLRVLDQLADDEFPLAVPVSRRLTCVDDCAFFADNKALARQTRDRLNCSRKEAFAFENRKWASNAPDLLSYPIWILLIMGWPRIRFCRIVSTLKC